MASIVNMKGNKYNRLTAIKRVDNTEGKGTKWLFKCECGNDHIARGGDVRSGKTQSCGCLLRESSIKRVSLMNSASRTHGMSYTPIYRIWYGMKGRCYTKSNTCYHNYGEKGITVCDEWINDPQAFINWAMENGYKKGLSIDRKDGTKGYSPDNCRWATNAEQMRNISSNVFIEFNGQVKIVADWSKDLGIHYDTIRNRLNRGLPINEVLKC